MFYGIGVRVTARTTVPLVAFAATCPLLLIPKTPKICHPLLEVESKSAIRGVGMPFVRTTYWPRVMDCVTGSIYADVPIIVPRLLITDATPKLSPGRTGNSVSAYPVSAVQRSGRAENAW